MPIDHGRTVKSVVTGGAGFIGHHLVNALVERGDEVFVIDNLSGGNFPERRNKKAHYYLEDITDSKKELLIDAWCKGADYIFHLAALPRVQFSIENPVDTARANVVGTVVMLNAAHKAGVKKFVFASSSSVYGDPIKLPLHESHVLNPMSPYARQKMQGEEYCYDYARDPFGLATVCLRFFNVYGAGADPEGAYALVIAKFLEQKKRGVPLTITGTGEQTRDFTHVRDVVRAILLAAESDSATKGEVINIGGGRRVTINHIAKLFGGEVQYVESRLEPRDTEASVDKAKRWLGWEPQVSIEEGIAELLRLNHS